MVYRVKFHDVDVEELRISNVPEKPPRVPTGPHVSWPFFSDAREIEAKPILKTLTYSYDGAQARCDVGAQILNSAGWRPNCTAAHSVNFARVPPPRFLPDAPVVIGSPESMRSVSADQAEGLTKSLNAARSSLKVFASAFSSRDMEQAVHMQK